MGDLMSEFLVKISRKCPWNTNEKSNIHSCELQVSEGAKKIAGSNNFEVKSYEFTALKEDLRRPRIVKVGAVQTSIVCPTAAPIHEQRDAIFSKIGKIIDAAGADNVNVICLQEAWSEFTDLRWDAKNQFNSFNFSSNAICILH